MNVSDNFVKILEEENITEVFGIPGEQIMPLYKSLSASKIKRPNDISERPIPIYAKNTS